MYGKQFVSQKALVVIKAKRVTGVRKIRGREQNNKRQREVNECRTSRTNVVSFMNELKMLISVSGTVGAQV